MKTPRGCSQKMGQTGLGRHVETAPFLLKENFGSVSELA